MNNNEKQVQSLIFTGFFITGAALGFVSSLILFLGWIVVFLFGILLQYMFSLVLEPIQVLKHMLLIAGGILVGSLFPWFVILAPIGPIYEGSFLESLGLVAINTIVFIAGMGISFVFSALSKIIRRFCH